MGEYWIIILVVALVIDSLTSLKFEKIANMKGHYGYFLWVFFSE